MMVRGRAHIWHTLVGDLLVSTVFLGLDFSLGRVGPPVLWETMVFGDVGDDGDVGWGRYQKRYRSLQEAREGHRQTVDEVKHGIILVE